MYVFYGFYESKNNIVWRDGYFSVPGLMDLLYLKVLMQLFVYYIE